MKRLRLIWLVFGLCLSALAATMLWASYTVLRLARAEQEAVAQAASEERIRLALWRMDSALTPLIAVESARPYFVYNSFYGPERAYNRMWQELRRDEILMPSPLLVQLPPNVLLHFQFAPDGTLTSPQAPAGNMRDLAESGYVTHQAVETAYQRLNQLRRESPREQLLAVVGQARPLDLPAVRPVLPIAPLASPKIMNSQQYQLNAGEWQSRVSNSLESVRNNASGNNVFNGQMQNLRPAEPGAMVVAGTLNTGVLTPGIMPAAPAAGSSLAAAAPTPVVEGALGPAWIGSALVLARSVTIDGKTYVQGCWLDWPAIQRNLLDSIRDLLPSAQLFPAAGGRHDHEGRMLAALPVRLEPGVIPRLPAGTGSPLYVSLAVAWVCVLLAAVVAGLLLRGAVAMSERRGAFVSAVTHEMRTPLTTFRMYAEMLAEGMVPEGEQRRQYLQTMCAEASRLSHLVENVLAYARLDGARGKARVETIGLPDLIDRVSGRLSQRAQQAGTTLTVESAATDAAAGVKVRADPSAVEQILLNLVDNACKYAASAENRTINLTASVAGSCAEIRLRDHGPGVPEAYRGRLFRAFSKSAHEAAVSAPGIGLGLALSRRLARNMGGELRHDAGVADGACFVLTLPLAHAAQ